MVLPLVIAGGAVAGAGILSYLNSKEAREASAAERKKLEEALAKIQEPSLGYQALTPEEFQVIGKFVPQEAAVIEQQAPEVVRAAGEGAKKGRSARMQILDRLMSQSQTGDDPIARIQQDQALRAAANQAASERASMDLSMQRRGVGADSGLGIAARLAGIGQQASLSAQGSEQAALAAEQRRRQALMDASNLGGQLFQEDVDIESRNADIINRFNDMMSARRQQVSNYNTGLQNESQKYNLGLQQSAADKNASLRNQYASDNLNRQYDLSNARYGNALSKYGRQADITNMTRNDIMGAAQDKNALYGSMANAAGTGAMAYGNYQARQEDRDFMREQNDLDRQNRAKYGYRGY